MSAIDLIVVTWNNPDQVYSCVNSILTHTVTQHDLRIILVNNGHPAEVEVFRDNPKVSIVQLDKNEGWEGGLKAGLKISRNGFIVMLNDDTFVPAASSEWLDRMLSHFKDNDCGAVGPASNFVMGSQNVFTASNVVVLKVPFLIGFCMMVKRSDLYAVGGIDDTLPGGDDLDLSIRLRKLGKYLICDKSVFIYHLGAQTGSRVHGKDWNSVDMVERTNKGLIVKHGLKDFLGVGANGF